MWTRVSQFIAYKIQPTSGTKWISPMIYRVLLRVQGEPKVKVKGTGYVTYDQCCNLNLTQLLSTWNLCSGLT